MKRPVFLLSCLTLFFSIFSFFYTQAQCSICTKTAQQLGEKPASALNAGIIYLAAAPLAIISYIGYRWWKSDHSE
jgi:hypothetical protein